MTGAGPDTVAAVERITRLAHLVKASDEDLDVLYPDLDLDEAVAHLLGLGPQAVVVTRGSTGATWYGAPSRVHVAARAVSVADTIGAGDTFGAALIDGLWSRGRLGTSWAGLSEQDVEELLDHAARCAAVTVSRPGADPPYRSELD